MKSIPSIVAAQVLPLIGEKRLARASVAQRLDGEIDELHAAMIAFD